MPKLEKFIELGLKPVTPTELLAFYRKIRPELTTDDVNLALEFFDQKYLSRIMLVDESERSNYETECVILEFISEECASRYLLSEMLKTYPYEEDVYNLMMKMNEENKLDSKLKLKALGLMSAFYISDNFWTKKNAFYKLYSFEERMSQLHRMNYSYQLNTDDTKLKYLNLIEKFLKTNMSKGETLTYEMQVSIAHLFTLKHVIDVIPNKKTKFDIALDRLFEAYCKNISRNALELVIELGNTNKYEVWKEMLKNEPEKSQVLNIEFYLEK